MRKILALLASLLIGAPAYGQSVSYTGTITRNHIPVWVSPGVLQDGGTSASSLISSIGITNNNGCALGINSAVTTSGAWNQLCLGVSTTGAATISLQNYGAASPQVLNFVINGITYPFPGALSSITIGSTPVTGGTDNLCLYVAGSVVGQQECTLSAITSLTGDVTATGPGVSVATLAASGVVAGTYGSVSTIPIITVDVKGRVTGATTTPVGITVGSTLLNSGSVDGLLYDNGGVLGNLATLINGVLVTNGSGLPSIATTLPAALTIPSPTFTGSVTFPDSATWASGGISKVAALSAGSATLPSSGNININGQYQVNGTQIAATNLLNGTTGTGAVVLAASPAISGTWTGSPVFSGNIGFSGQLIETGTSAPSSAAGNTVVLGTLSSAPTLANTGQSFLYNTTVNGAAIQGDGSTNDVSIFNKSGALVAGVPTGTTKLNFPSLSAGSCSSGLGLDSGNNTVLISCPGSTASVQVGTTQIISGTNGDCLYSNGGTLGNHPCISEAQGRLTLLANTPVMTTSASAQTTLRYDCYNGGQVPYYDGTQDNIDSIASCEVTDAMVAAASAGQVVASQVFDVWWVHSGTNRICLAMSASTGGGGGWAFDSGGGSNTARGTGYSQLDRVTRPYTTNKNSISNCFNAATNYGPVSANQGTYLGTVYSFFAGQISFTYGSPASGGSEGLLGVWNMYNRVVVSTTVTDNGTPYTYTSATPRQARASSTNQVQIVLGLQEDSVTYSYVGTTALVATSGADTVMGVGVDSTSAFSVAGVLQSPAATVFNGTQTLPGQMAGVGFHTIAAMEAGDGGHANTFDETAAGLYTSAQLTVTSKY